MSGKIRDEIVKSIVDSKVSFDKTPTTSELALELPVSPQQRGLDPVVSNGSSRYHRCDDMIEIIFGIIASKFEVILCANWPRVHMLMFVQGFTYATKRFIACARHNHDELCIGKIPRIRRPAHHPLGSRLEIEPSLPRSSLAYRSSTSISKVSYQ